MQVSENWDESGQRFRNHLTLEKGLAGNSVAAYMRDFEHLRRHAIDNGVAPCDVSVELLRELLGELNDTGIAITTQCRLVSGWRTFFSMMVL